MSDLDKAVRVMEHRLQVLADAFGEGHTPCVVYKRSWRRLWRKQYAVMCWGCPWRVEL